VAGNGGNGSIEIGYGKWRIGASGIFAVLVAVLLGIAVSNIAMGLYISRELVTQTTTLSAGRTEDHRERAREHATIMDSATRLACINAIVEVERVAALRSGDPCAWVFGRPLRGGR
jgi:hypothetical protein